MKNLWLPTIPYTLIDCINRVALATGSMRYAASGADADYNGHYVTVEFNDYRKYWVAHYTWAGINRLARGSVQDCLRAGADEYRRGAKGCTVVAGNVPDDVLEFAASLGYVEYSDEIRDAHNATWRDARFTEVNSAMRYERQLGCPAVGFLANSATLEEYQAKVDAFFKVRRTKNGASTIFTPIDDKGVEAPIHGVTDVAE